MSYSQLKTDITSYMHRGDLEPLLDGFIARAEARIYREVRALSMEATTQLTPTQGVSALPADFLALREISYPVSASYQKLGSVGRGLITTYRGVTGNPLYYSIQGFDVEIAPAPDGSITFDVLYWKRFPPLSDADPENEFETINPDLFLYASLIEAATYVRDYDYLPTVVQQYQEIMQKLNSDADTTRYGEAPVIGVI